MILFRSENWIWTSNMEPVTYMTSYNDVSQLGYRWLVISGIRHCDTSCSKKMSILTWLLRNIIFTWNHILIWGSLRPSSSDRADRSDRVRNFFVEKTLSKHVDWCAEYTIRWYGFLSFPLFVNVKLERASLLSTRACWAKASSSDAPSFKSLSLNVCEHY